MKISFVSPEAGRDKDISMFKDHFKRSLAFTRNFILSLNEKHIQIFDWGKGVLRNIKAYKNTKGIVIKNSK